MSFNLMEVVKNYFTNDFTRQASSTLGENNDGISKALSAIIPTGLAGILGKATSGTQGANDILSMAKNAVGSLTGGASGLVQNTSNETGRNMASNLFGNNQSGIMGAISRFAGIKDSSVMSLMSMGLPAIMGLLGKHAEENNLSATGMSGFLSSQKDHIMNAMPSGLSSIAGMLGLGSAGAAASSIRSDVRSGVNDTRRVAESVVEKPGGNKWLIPLLAILAAIALIWYFSKGCNDKTQANDTVGDTTVAMVAPATMDTPAMAATTTSETIKVKLPNGTELDANKGGIEDQLVTFLSGDWKSMSNDDLKAKWFNFDDLNFNTGTATLVPKSEKQLDNIAEILKAFPDAKLKIGGYTDATGDAAKNKALSKNRAMAAKNGLAKRGVGKQVTDAEGYGSEFAKAAATAPDSERAMDRHVSVSVRK
ncbi:MAG: OmpA family protein [Ginsengibacter sp.]